MRYGFGFSHFGRIIIRGQDYHGITSAVDGLLYDFGEAASMISSRPRCALSFIFDRRLLLFIVLAASRVPLCTCLLPWVGLLARIEAAEGFFSHSATTSPIYIRISRCRFRMTATMIPPSQSVEAGILSPRKILHIREFWDTRFSSGASFASTRLAARLDLPRACLHTRDFPSHLSPQETADSLFCDALRIGSRRASRVLSASTIERVPGRR